MPPPMRRESHPWPQRLMTAEEEGWYQPGLQADGGVFAPRGGGWGLPPDQQAEGAAALQERYERPLNAPFDPEAETAAILAGTLGAGATGSGSAFLRALRGRSGKPGPGTGGPDPFRRGVPDSWGLPGESVGPPPMAPMGKTQIMPPEARLPTMPPPATNASFPPLPTNAPAAWPPAANRTGGLGPRGAPAVQRSPQADSMESVLQAMRAGHGGMSRTNMVDDLGPLAPMTPEAQASVSAHGRYRGPDQAELAARYDDEWWANLAKNPPPAGRYTAQELEAVDPLPPLAPMSDEFAAELARRASADQVPSGVPSVGARPRNVKRR